MKVLYYFFASLILILIVAIFLIIKDANSVSGDKNPINISPEYFLSKIEKITDFGWSKKLSSNSNAKLDRPISNELYINLDLEDVYDLSKKKYFKLDIDKKDPYSMFCVKQALQNRNLKYFLITNKQDSQIVIDTQDFAILHGLIDDLKSNKIKSNFIEIWL